MDPTDQTFYLFLYKTSFHLVTNCRVSGGTGDGWHLWDCPEIWKIFNLLHQIFFMFSPLIFNNLIIAGDRTRLWPADVIFYNSVLLNKVTFMWSSCRPRFSYSYRPTGWPQNNTQTVPLCYPQVLPRRRWWVCSCKGKWATLLDIFVSASQHLAWPGLSL